MGKTWPTAREIVRRGQAIDESQIRPRVERDHFGKYLVIDIEYGEYEIDADHLAASNRAAAKHPDAPLFATRIGYRAGGRIGARPRMTLVQSSRKDRLVPWSRRGSQNGPSVHG